MNRREFARNLAAGTYDLIVLDLLRDGPNYGYGIVKRIFERSRHTILWQEGTLYPVLHRLEKRGLLTSVWTSQPAPGRSPRRGRAGRNPSRRRRYYQITARGQRCWHEHYQQWRTFTRAVNALLAG